MKISNLPIWLRLSLGFGILLLLLLVTGAVGLWGTENLSAQTATSLSTDGAIAEHIALVSNHSLGLRRYEKDIFLNIDTPEKVAGYYKKWQAEYAKLVEHIASLEKLTTLPEEKQQVKAMKQGAESYKTGFAGIYQQLEQNRITTPQAGNQAMKAFKGPIRTMIENATAITASSYARMQALKSEIKKVEQRTQMLIASVMTVAVALLGLLAWAITRSITRPIGQVNDLLNALGQGNISQRLRLEQKDEFGEMARNIDRFSDNLKHQVVSAFEHIARGNLAFEAQGFIKVPLEQANQSLSSLVSQIRCSAEQIASGSSQVSTSAQTLSQGATRSAASLEEISSSMSQIGGQTDQSAGNANQANLLASEAAKAATTGSEHMADMITAMGEINAAGRDINKIIKVIDEIAFQTNLLALNAAVEAARAGQHGKGFAVVAEEVRNLAARSAKAAQETAELIEGSVVKASNGTQIAERTAGSLEEIVAAITKVDDLLGEIAAASRDQAQGISQVNIGLQQIDQVVQQNTASAEESAATSEQLSGQALELQQLLSRFILSNLKRPRHPVEQFFLDGRN